MAKSNGSFTPYQFVNTRSWKKVDDILTLKGAVLERAILDTFYTEGPVHIDHLLNRFATFYDTKLGARIRRHLELHIDNAVQLGQLIRREDFLWMQHYNPANLTPRDHTEVPKKDIRKIASEEIHEAFKQIIRESFGINREELISETGSRLGFERVSQPIRAYLDELLLQMLERGILKEEDGVVKLFIT